VSAGLYDDGSYHGCQYGPAAEGIYPSYVSCEAPPSNPYINAFLKCVEIGLHKGK
jgi:hypothetical protein